MMTPMTFKACAVQNAREQDVFYAAVHIIVGDSFERTYCYTDKRFSVRESAALHAQRLLASMSEGLFASAVELPGIIHSVAFLGGAEHKPGKREGLN